MEQTGALIDRFVAHKRAAGISKSTIYGYQAALRHFAAWLGDRPINRPALRGYLHHLQHESKLQVTTVERYWSAVGTFVGWIVKEGIAPAAPRPRAPLQLPARVPDLGEDPRDRQVVPGSLEDLIMQFIDSKRAAGLSPKTIRTYAERLRYFASWLGDRPLTRTTLRQYLIHLQERPSLAPTSRASYFRDIGTFCRFCSDEGIWQTNPAQKLRIKVPKRLMPSYTREQIRQLLAVCNERDRVIIVLLLDTGLRVAELCSLRRRDINWESGAFTVIGKGNQERAVFLNPYTVELLRAYLGKRRDTDPALWMGKFGPLTTFGVYQVIKRRAIEAGIIGDIRRILHSFRATFAKNYIKQGGSLDDLRQLLGHSSLEMASHYAALASADLATQKRRINPLGAMFDEAT